ncbi:hypothetical protein BFS16_11445 [Hoylesella timonensis]|uniref:Uncharacterized protein n=2 Tax=Hoylesella timonensis TaxID=386414 RepID=A0A2K0XCD5_9BACT|nr:hypothetical protein BFS16_11445 [Hoylesella timonensis]
MHSQGYLKRKYEDNKNMLSRFLVIIFSLILATNTYAERGAKVGNVTMGMDYEQALDSIRTEFGKPNIVNQDTVLFRNLSYRGFVFDKVLFKFKAAKFNEARFFIYAKNKAAAVKDLSRLSEAFKKNYSLAEDYEDGLYFYKGGISPKGIGHLFTISVAKRQGNWNTELTFGPF